MVTGGGSQDLWWWHRDKSLILQLLKQWHWSLQPDTGRHSHKVLWCIDELTVWFGIGKAAQRAVNFYYTTHINYFARIHLFLKTSIKVITLIIIRVEYEPVIQIVGADQLGEKHIRVSAHSPGGILTNLEIYKSQVFLQVLRLFSPRHQQYPPRRWVSCRTSLLNPGQFLMSVKVLIYQSSYFILGKGLRF